MCHNDTLKQLQLKQNADKTYFYFGRKNIALDTKKNISKDSKGENKKRHSYGGETQTKDKDDVF